MNGAKTYPEGRHYDYIIAPPLGLSEGGHFMCSCRMTITITHEVKRELEQLKKTMYWNVPYSEMYRDLIRRGLEAESEACEKMRKSA